jgi:transcriptional regulator with XRE-family HTH domain
MKIYPGGRMNREQNHQPAHRSDQFLVLSESDLGALMLALRRARGLTQAELALQAGVLPKTVSAIENSVGHVLVGTLMRCISALEIDLIVAPRVPQTPTLPPPQPSRRARTNVGKEPKRAAKSHRERW